MSVKMNAKELRDMDENESIPQIKRRPIYLILDTIYDTYNIGGLFRLADSLAAEKLYICGDSEIPPNNRIKKASIGTYKVVPWEYKENPIDAIHDLRKTVKDIQIVSVEQNDKSVPYQNFEYTSPLALVVGNETHGVSQEVMDASDAIVELPMHGINSSLNVIVSAAIVAFHATA